MRSDQLDYLVMSSCEQGNIKLLIHVCHVSITNRTIFLIFFVDGSGSFYHGGQVELWSSFMVWYLMMVCNQWSVLSTHWLKLYNSFNVCKSFASTKIFQFTLPENPGWVETIFQLMSSCLTMQFPSKHIIHTFKILWLFSLLW